MRPLPQRKTFLPFDGARPNAAERTQEAIVLLLRSRILRGEYSPGTLLPPERDLARQLGVSRTTLRAALGVLAGEGLLRQHEDTSVEVLDFRRSGRLDLFAWLMAQKDVPPDHVVDLFGEVARLRRVVAIDTLMQAAGRALEEDLEELDAIARAQRRRFDDPIAYLGGDLEHQRRIIRITGSTAIELLFNSLERLMWQHADLVLVFVGPLPEHWKSYGIVHRALRRRRSRFLRAKFERALDQVEGRGLIRVRDYVHRLAEARAARA